MCNTWKDQELGRWKRGETDQKPLAIVRSERRATPYSMNKEERQERDGKRDARQQVKEAATA